MSFHAEVLPPEQEAALRQLGRAATDLGFYLGGGTATAIHFGHRQSVDFDWFTAQSLDDPLGLSRELQSRGVDLKVGSVQRKTLHGQVAGVRVSFLEFRYPLLQPLVIWAEFGCQLASLEDLAAMKLLAVSQRGTKKDFLDVYALGAHGLSIPEMLNLFRQKFSVEDVGRVTYSLCYFDDADADPMPTMLTSDTWPQAKTAIRDWVRAMTDGAGAHVENT
jgi:hypothetical protein